MEVIISVIENQPGETIERHIHHGEEAFYVLQGATLETADGKQITCGPESARKYAIQISGGPYRG